MLQAIFLELPDPDIDPPGALQEYEDPPEAENVYPKFVKPEVLPDIEVDPVQAAEIGKSLRAVYVQPPFVAVTHTALFPVVDQVIVLVLPLPVTDEVEPEYEKV